MKRAALLLLFAGCARDAAVAQQVPRVVEVTAPAFGLRELGPETLVVVNENAPGAQEIANAYASARDAHLCEVSVSPGLYGTRAELDSVSASCARDGVSHLVLIRGMPARLVDGDDEPSFDYYLAEALGGLAYGRIEAINTERTLALIERTLDAERAGFSGNVLHEDPPGALHDALAARFSSSDDACTRYLSHTPFEWPHERCRVGSTGASAGGLHAGGVPGESRTTISRAVNVGLFLGTKPLPNTHAAFDGFETMTRWRKSATPCTPLCESAACRASSTDVFGELDTRCVGAALGFMGHQVRSYPVQYYGFFPEGWSPTEDGAVEKVPPVVDDGHFHFGMHSAKKRARPGAPKEKIAVSLGHDIALQRDVEVRFSVRHAASPSGRLHARFGDATLEIPLDDEQPGWRALSFRSRGGERLAFSASLEAPALEFLDIGHVEIKDARSGARLFDLEGLDRHRSTTAGDYAANIIDRLGGIAAWGSSSHHETEGWAFADDRAMSDALFSGRTLGQSLRAAGGGASGIIYGDPLYRPAAIAIVAPEENVFSTTKAELEPLRVTVYQGSESAHELPWQIEHRTGERWVTRLSARGAVRDFAVALEDLVPLDDDKTIELRVRALVLGGLVAHTRLNYWHRPPRACRDVTGDLEVTASDVERTRQNRTCTAAHLQHDRDGDRDVDDDDLFSADDRALAREHMCQSTPDPRFDLDQDGDVDDDDVNLVEAALGPCVP